MHGTNPNDVNGGRKRRMDWDPLDLNSNGNIGSSDPKIPNLAACGKDQRRKDNIIANGNGPANANGSGSGKPINIIFGNQKKTRYNQTINTAGHCFFISNFVRTSQRDHIAIGVSL